MSEDGRRFKSHRAAVESPDTVINVLVAKNVAAATWPGVVVTYTIEVETAEKAASVSALIEDSSTEDVSTAVKRAATEAGADEDFADVETTAVGTPTMGDL